MCGVVSTECPHLSAVSFEHTLSSDDVLAHFFNDFLSLPSFPETLLYNQETGLFEVVSGAAEFISRRIRSVMDGSKSQLLTRIPTVLTRTPPADSHYTVRCLDREQGIQWITEERLPFFLQSDYYVEYRLAKLLFQWDPNLCIQRRKSSSSRTYLSTPQLCCSSQFDRENNNALKALTCSNSLENISAQQGPVTMYNFTYLPSGQKEHINTKCRESSRCFSSCSEQDYPCTFSSLSSSCSSPSNLKCEKTQDLQSPQTELRLCFTEPSAGNSKMKYLTESSSQNFESSELQLEYLAARVVKQVLNNALNVMGDQSQDSISDCTSTEKSCECNVCRHSSNGGRERLNGKKEKVQEGKRGSEAKTEWHQKNREVGRTGTDQESIPDICCHGTCCQYNRAGLDKFKEFLRGTSGEKLYNLWMDIEKLKAVQHRERKNRYLVLMRGRYLLSSSQSSLNSELLSTLGLTTSPCWTEEKLCSVQPYLTEALLYYWVPRFWKSRCAQKDQDDTSNVGLWSEGWKSPLSGRQIHRDPLTLPPLLHGNGLFRSSHTVHSQLYFSRSQSLGSRRMEKMFQALCVDSRAGLYFTHFCVQSGNQLWESAVYFWTDLQHYHELFYQDGMDPYRVQREAQILYATYVYSSARRSIGVDEEIRRKVYDQLMPAFEELFDEVEEYTLNILLEPWTLLVSRDKESFQKVRVQEEVHTVESREPREPRSVYEESQRQKEVQQSRSMQSLSPTASSTPFSKGPQASDSWSRVSPNYQGYRLGSLLRHRHEIGHFMSFLQSQDASIHLTCWLDLEQYRRTPQKDKAVKQERSSHIATKYLNKKYFFGPDSPASTEQQNDILHLAGGLERLRLECLSNLVVVEIQDIIRTHIEKIWLPQFLSTAEFTERQKHKPKPQAAGWLSQHVYHRRRTRRKAWKAEGLWMSSSKEILLFRQILLNPVTCMQFQHFVSLKGDFLENDMLFWLEVQRYKDLCHSHSDEATIQQKISTIIDCFIDSSMPPTLQIDIPPEQAQHILEKRHELGPYIFREAQMSVFSELLKFWPEFQELSSSVQEEQLLPLLQEKRVKHRARVRRQRRKEEEEEQEEEEDERRRVQEEWEAQESNFSEEEDTDEDIDDVKEEREGRSGKKQSRTQSRVLVTPTQPLSWSYSKYMAALKREEVLLRKKSQLEASFSTASDSSSYCSVRSAGSKHSLGQSHRSSRADSKQCNRYKRGVRACNMK
ncbi:regulator of G-protein signaling 22 [Toxotes jaculatrix]|uniref:regulator of G-protein signaling 22 n=1 Tax=Toxotes jaculatrix TaxID=941984 RepID=UPI001B3A929D|nr:regulator of G-protein signaling 22 [Toxotes jaculatrix]